MSTIKINDCCNATTAEPNHSCNCKTTMKFEDYIMDELRNGKSMDEIMKYISDRANAAESTFKAEQNKKEKSPWAIIDGAMHDKLTLAFANFVKGNTTFKDFIILLIEGLYQIAPTMRPMIDEIDLDDADIDILAETMEKELDKFNKSFSVAKTFADGDDDVSKITKFLDSLI